MKAFKSEKTRESAERYAREYPQLGSLVTIPQILENALTACRDVGNVVVDVGCGEGSTLAALRTAAFSGRLLGVELSLERVRIALDRGLPAIVADGFQLPFRDASVALVICRNVIEHVVDEISLLRELHRVLPIGGYCYLETALRLAGAWYPYRNRDGVWVLDPTHLREYASPDHMEDLLRENGFSPDPIEVVPLRFPVAHLVFRALRRGIRPGRLARRVLDATTLSVRVPRYREIRILARAVAFPTDAQDPQGRRNPVGQRRRLD